jgi:hypothetical protein
MWLAQAGVRLVQFADYVWVGGWWQCAVQVALVAGVFVVRGRPYSPDAVVAALYPPRSKASAALAALLSFVWTVVLPVLLCVRIITFIILHIKVVKMRRTIEGSSRRSGRRRTLVSNLCVCILIPHWQTVAFVQRKCSKNVSVAQARRVRGAVAAFLLDHMTTRRKRRERCLRSSNAYAGQTLVWRLCKGVIHGIPFHNSCHQKRYPIAWLW